MPSPFVVDAIGLSTIITSIIVNCILAVSAGAISTYNIPAADIIVRVNYILWTILTAGVSTSVIYFGSKLVSILNRQLKATQAGSERHRKLKAGILRVS
jgi:membrane-anchored glycerophosphoryl diester phosphodiesterase (GDPDase)